MKNVIRGTKRPGDANSIGENARKKSETVESRVDRNKRLLQTMEEVIRTMNEDEVPFEVALESVQTIEAVNKVAETNITQIEDHEKEGQEPKEIEDDEAAEQFDVEKPTFMKPELEKLLDDSMQRAVQKYRIGGNTWKRLKQQSLMQDDPEKEKSESSLQNYLTSNADLRL